MLSQGEQKMSKTRVYSQDTIDVQQRFFQIVQELLDAGRLPGGLAGFCETYKIDRRHFYTQRSDMNRGYFEVGWIIPLVKYFKVSANWLLLGTGKIYKG